MVGNSRDPKLPNYYVKIGDALVQLSYPHWKRGPNGQVEFRAHAFAADELESIFDSLRQARPEDLMRFPGMIVDVERGVMPEPTPSSR
jgi:hypothetical protein